MDQARFSSHLSNLSKAEQTLKKLVDQLNFINTDFNKATNVMCVRRCNSCHNYAWTPERGFFCYRTNLETTKEDFCSKYESIRPSLCWDCENTCGGCSWTEQMTADETVIKGTVAKFEPVEGWEAVPTNISNSQSYCVIKCPKFKKDSYTFKRVITTDDQEVTEEVTEDDI